MIREFIKNKTLKKIKELSFVGLLSSLVHIKRGIPIDSLNKTPLKSHINKCSMHDRRKLPKSTKSFVDRAVFVSCNILRKVNYLQPISHETGIV